VPRIPGWLFYVVTLTIVGLWAVGVVLTFVSSSFQMPESLNGALPIVLVALYTTKAASDRRRGGDDDEQ
jgi:hypothetical protein